MTSGKPRALAENKSSSGKKNGMIRKNLYARLFERVKDSIHNEYFLEAITLEESFMADRLESYGFYKALIKGSKMTLGQLNSPLKKKESSFSKDLLDQVHKWWKGRCKCIHEMPKFDDGEDPDWDERMKHAKQIAAIGEKLMRSVNKEIARLRRSATYFSLKQ